MTKVLFASQIIFLIIVLLYSCLELKISATRYYYTVKGEHSTGVVIDKKISYSTMALKFGVTEHSRPEVTFTTSDNEKVQGRSANERPAQGGYIVNVYYFSDQPNVFYVDDFSTQSFVFHMVIWLTTLSISAVLLGRIYSGKPIKLRVS